MKFIAITGARRGLGKETSKAFRAADWSTLELNRPEFDLSNPATIGPHLFREYVGREWDKAVLVNNAQSLVIGSFGELSREDLAREVNANILGQMSLAWTFLKAFPNGKIVNITSAAARFPISGWSLYCTSKAATKMFFDVLNSEGHDTVQFDPGIMDTQMQEYVRGEQFPDRQRYLDARSNQKLQPAAEVATKLLAQLES